MRFINISEMNIRVGALSSVVLRFVLHSWVKKYIKAKLHPAPPETDSFEVWWEANRYELLDGLEVSDWEAKRIARRAWKTL